MIAKVAPEGWNAGEPPSVGWWPASAFFNMSTLRYWDGECWSIGIAEFATAEEAAKWAQRKADPAYPVFWHARPDNWPENAK